MKADLNVLKRLSLNSILGMHKWDQSENDFITNSTVAYRYNSFLSRFNIIKSTLTQQSKLSSEQNEFFSSVSLFS